MDGREEPAEPVRTPGWRSRIVGTGVEAPDQLLANPRNWRIHPGAQQEALAEVLDRVGWVEEVLVNRRSGFVIDGHLRVALAISREEPEVPVRYVDLSDEEEALVLASLDPLAAIAGTDGTKLAELLEEVRFDAAGLADYLEAHAARTLGDVLPPDEFPSLGDHVETDTTCPKCGYSWRS